MLGPVFSLELLLAVRRGRLNVFRCVYGGWWLLQLAVICVFLFQYEMDTASAGAVLGPFLQASFQVLVAQQFIFLVLATPAFVAGAITDEKSQGTLPHLLTADLSSWEIIMGKFLGRMAQVALLAVAGWPIVCFLAGYGHIGVPALLASALVAGVIFVVLGAASVWASVRSKQTRDAVLRVYAWSALAILTIWGGLEAIRTVAWRFKPGTPMRHRLSQMEGVLRYLDPLSVLDSVWGQDDLQEFFSRCRILLLVYGGMAVIFLTLAVWRFRSMYIRELTAAGRARRTWWRRTRREVDEDPIRWREATARGKVPRWLGLSLLAAVTCATSLAIHYSREPTLFAVQGVVFLFLASLVAGIRTSGAVTGERERQTWDSLLLTPLDTWDLILDNLHGTLDTLRPYFFAFAIPATLIALWTGIDAFVFTVTLHLLTWTAMYYMASTGLWCSVRAKGSWRSLLATLTTGYGYLLAILFLIALVYVWASCGIFVVVIFLLKLVGISATAGMSIVLSLLTSLIMSWFLWRASYPKLDKARAWVDEHERYGRTFVRSLSSALRKHYQHLEERRRHEDREPHMLTSPANVATERKAR
jgi:ABC-type transport system involved in multi-copper enzyme maturation permease subunit